MLGWTERVGLLLLHLFPNGGATDIVFVALFCRIAAGTATAWCGGRCAMPDGHWLNILSVVILAAVHGSLGLPGWRLFRGFTLLSPFSHSTLASHVESVSDLLLLLRLSSHDIKFERAPGAQGE